MMDRQTKLAILNAASDDALNNALSAIGVSCGDGDPYGEKAEADGGGLLLWNDLKPGVKESTRPPIVDKASAFGEMRERPRDAYGLSMRGGEEEDAETAALMTGLL